MRTLGYDHGIGRAQPRRKVAQAAQRQEHVLVQRTIIVHKDYIVSGLQFPVLESVVEDDKLRRLQILVGAFAGLLGRLDKVRMAKETAALDTVLVHRHRDGRELLLDLYRLVAVKGGAGAADDLLEALAPALVAARQHGDVAETPVVAALQHAQEHLRVRGLSRPPDGDVAYADGRHFGLPGLADESFVEESVPDTQHEVVWKQNKFVYHGRRSGCFTKIRKNQRP